jgi:hypothetical protein
MNLFKWICDKCNAMSGIKDKIDADIDVYLQNITGEYSESKASKPAQDAGKFHAPNDYRVKRGVMGSDDSYGNDGAFQIPSCHRDEVLTVISSDGLGWEHVSVSLGPQSKKCPSWDEMCQVKNLFWDEDVAVIQFHPPRTQYVNKHKGCLHMWRRAGRIVELPPMFMVG